MQYYRSITVVIPSYRIQRDMAQLLLILADDHKTEELRRAMVIWMKRSDKGPIREVFDQTFHKTLIGRLYEGCPQGFVYQPFTCCP